MQKRSLIKMNKMKKGKINYVKGDLITLAQQGKFDIIAHGCNCFSTMRAGIAKQMAATFGCDQFRMETDKSIAPASKLGKIDASVIPGEDFNLIVVNAYTQYYPGANLDEDALRLTMEAINEKFQTLVHIGLPKIGAGIAGGDWDRIVKIIEQSLTDLYITVVEYDPTVKED